VEVLLATSILLRMSNRLVGLGGAGGGPLQDCHSASILSTRHYHAGMQVVGYLETKRSLIAALSLVAADGKKAQQPTLLIT
jgi:hypothetical protein